MWVMFLVLHILRVTANRIPVGFGQLWRSIEALLPNKNHETLISTCCALVKESRASGQSNSYPRKREGRKNDHHSNVSFFIVIHCKINSYNSRPLSPTIRFFIRAMYHRHCRNFWSRVEDMAQWIRISALQECGPECGSLSLTQKVRHDSACLQTQHLWDKCRQTLPSLKSKHGERPYLKAIRQE